jgi:hypothetical protein
MRLAAMAVVPAEAQQLGLTPVPSGERFVMHPRNRMASGAEAQWVKP